MKKMSIEGKVVFLWSAVDTTRPWCACCGDPKKPHAHNFNRHIAFDGKPSKVFAGGHPLIQSVADFEQEFLHLVPNLEGKKVKVTIAVIEE